MHRLPGPEAVPPARHRRLLVEVAVEQDGVGRAVRRGRVAGGGHLDEEERRAALELQDLDREPVDRRGAASQARASSTARSMWPASAQPAS